MLYAYVDTIAQEHYCPRCGRIREANGQTGLAIVQESVDHLPQCADCFDDIDVPLTDDGIAYYTERYLSARRQLADCTEGNYERGLIQDRLYAYEGILRDNGVYKDW